MDSIKFDCYSTISFKASDPLSHSRSYLGAWWEVDLGEGVAVSTVIIYNRIGDATNVPVFDINFSGINGVLITKAPTFKPTAFPTASPSKNAALVHKVRVQLEGTNALHMREVQVYDTSGVNNRALNKSASQSSTYIDSLPYKAVNGDLNDYSHTNHDAGNVS
jgi:hypothetical protein